MGAAVVGGAVVDGAPVVVGAAVVSTGAAVVFVVSGEVSSSLLQPGL